ncbi:MAG: hypothetical protein AVDCRST_MAG08-69, partial [uncultured Acetobacteraceae bacterium]
DLARRRRGHPRRGRLGAGTAPARRRPAVADGRRERRRALG